MISKTAAHAIAALVRLARLREGEFSGAARLARELGAPPNYLGKLLQQLSRRGLLESRKGLRGGFRLGRDPGSISLHDVVEPVEGSSPREGCLLGLPVCSDEGPCPMHDEWKRLREDYLALVGRTTIAEIVRRSGRSAGDGGSAVPGPAGAGSADRGDLRPAGDARRSER